MTNTDLLKQKIEESGVKYAFIADKLGMSRQGLSQKIAQNGDFKAWQMLSIVDILHLSDDEARDIFYAQNVD